MISIDDDKKKFIEITGRIMSRWGYTYTDGLVYGTLLMNPRPLKISEIAKATKLSRSAVSSSLSRLARNYLVTVSMKGKTKLFSPVPAFLKIFLQQPKEMLDKEVVPLKKLTEKILENENNGDFKKWLREVLNDLSTLERILRKIIEMEEQEI